MAIIQSGSTSTLWTIDPNSDAGRITLYDQNGNPMSDISSLNNVLNALNASITIILGGQATLGINVSGTSGSLTLVFEATIDNINWFSISATPIGGGITVSTTSANGQWVASTSGYYSIRTRISAFTSGSMTVSVVLTPETSNQITQNITTSGSLTVAQPTAANLNATVQITDGTNTLGTSGHPIRIDPTGTTIQPVSGTVGATQSGTWTVQPGNTANTTPWLTTINQGGNSATVTASNALKIDGSAVTQPISGTITAAQATAANLNATVVQGTSPWVENISQFGGNNVVTGTGASGVGIPRVTVSNDSNVIVSQSTAANLNATVAGTVSSNQGTANTLANAWPQKITDGTNGPAAVKAASTQSAAADSALVVALSPGSAQTRSATATVAGVASSASSVTILAANAARLGAIIINSSTAILYLKYATTAASIASGGYTISVPISGGTHEVPFGYTGQINGIWASVNGFCNVTELSV